MDLNPVPLEQSRINRLLRPLRSSLAVLHSEIDLANNRLSALNGLQAHRLKQSNKGKGRAIDDDPEYGTAKRVGGLKKRGKMDQLAADGSSPLHGTVTRHKTTKATYGSKRSTSASTSSHPSHTYSTSSAQTFSTTLDLDDISSPAVVMAKLQSAGLEREVITKALHVFRAYRNALEAVYLLPASQRRSSGQRREPPRERRIPTLAELMAREIGWGLEMIVSTREESNAEGDLESDTEGEEKVRRARSPSAQDDNDNALIEEWYKACPSYTRNGIFAQHATAILVDGLSGTSYTLLECAFNTAVSLAAVPEVARFFEPLLSLAFEDFFKPCRPPSAYDLLNLVKPLHLQAAFCSALTTTMFLSPFSSRYFYSEFISFAGHRSTTESESTTLRRLLMVQLEVGSAMLESINDLRGEEDEDDADALAEQVIARISKQIGICLQDLLLTFSYEKNDGAPRKIEVLNTLQDLIATFPREAGEPLAPYSAVLELSGWDNVDTAEIVSRLERLAFSPSLELSGDVLFSRLPTAHQGCPPWLISRVAQALHDANQYALAASLLSAVVKNYEVLVQDFQHYSDFETSFSKEAFSLRLVAAEGLYLAAQGSGDAHGARQWRHEALVDAYVATTSTPNRKKPPPSDHPLATSSLRRPFRLKAKVIPSKPCLTGGSGPRLLKKRRIRSWKEESTDTESAGDLTTTETETQVEDDDEEVSATASAPRNIVIDLSLDDDDEVGSVVSHPLYSDLNRTRANSSTIMDAPIAYFTSEADDLDLLHKHSKRPIAEDSKGSFKRRKVEKHYPSQEVVSEDEMAL